MAITPAEIQAEYMGPAPASPSPSARALDAPAAGKQARHADDSDARAEPAACAADPLARAARTRPAGPRSSTKDGRLDSSTWQATRMN